jgi:large subunit ribosomal protein L4
MSKLAVINSSGQEVASHTLNEAIAAAGVPQHLIHRAVTTEEANKRQGTHSAKTRSETRGGGRKPYKQKKTGNARQGTTRAPHWAHGGMAFAIKPRDYTRGLNKKERRLAIIGAFNAKVESGDIILIDSVALAAPKTKDAAAILKNAGVEGVKRVLLVLESYDAVALKSFRNLPNVEVRTAPNREGSGQPFSARDILVAHKIVMTAGAMAAAERAWLKEEAK